MLLKEMEQYHIDRDEMEEIVDQTIGYDSLLDLFDSANYNFTESFHWFRSDNEYYIVHLPSGMMINWYKHLGRTNTCSQRERSRKDYVEFFNLLKEEIQK